MTHGMVLGKFMPPHLGHVYLCDFARSFVSDVSIVVGTMETEPIDGQLRFEWMTSLFPTERVIHLNRVLPQDPSEDPNFWQIWEEALIEVLPEQKLDYVFASESYGRKLAEVLGAQFIPVDQARQIRPVSGSEVRDDPVGNWDLLPNCVRSWYAKRVCVFGPESTGKSTLTQMLAKRFKSLAVPEYARTWLELQDGEVSLSDMLPIARGQIASEESLRPYCNRVLFTDTDVLATTIWSQVLFGECPSFVEQQASERLADLYLLLDVDVPWVDDVVRYLPENRKEFFNHCEECLLARNANYVRISGGWESRFLQAVAAVERILEQ